MIHSDITATPADTPLFQSSHTINPLIDVRRDNRCSSTKSEAYECPTSTHCEICRLLFSAYTGWTLLRGTHSFVE